ncbi:Peroxisomal membrane 22 kDa (Mpv17/PMP22) family protein [Euphorbia peplus]|nr:Peroxisomal membrane 22 kDa (Mpv17/PMP22) family protein [Euphorbia peplus]
MSGSFLRNSGVHHLLRRTTISDISSDPATKMMAAFNRHQISHSRPYFRFSQYFRKSSEVFPYIFPSSGSASSSWSGNVGGAFVGWYLGMIKTRPILTKSVTSSLIYVAADLSSQTIGRTESESYDFLRTLRMAGYGMLILGPSLHFWFNFVSKHFPKRDLITTFKKMVMGQTLYGPVMTVVFFSINARLQGENSDEIVARLKRDLLPTMLNGVMYWPLCDFITFRFTPVQLQPLVSNSFSYLWTVYMTYMASKEKADATN